jgi:diadenosine tetraphosphate (Ap4A) HIT family hydrolase
MTMAQTELDPRFATDCITMGKLETSLLLLMNNSLLPWFILIPPTSKTEIIDLNQVEQQQLQHEINLLGSFVRTNFKASKLNIAAIGNIVSQLHIHVVGRNSSDYCWPNVVWGTTEKKLYTDLQVNETIKLLEIKFGDSFACM